MDEFIFGKRWGIALGSVTRCRWHDCRSGCHDELLTTTHHFIYFNIPLRNDRIYGKNRILFRPDFPKSRSIWKIINSLYFFAIIIILSSAYVMKHVLFKGKTSSFILELPEYKLPSFRYIAYDVLTKAWSFIERAGSVILLASIVVWFLISFNFKLQYGVDIDSSMLAFFGKILSYVFYPMLGELSWAASVSAIQGLVAKEQVVGSMAIIAGYTSDVGEGNLIFNSGIFGFFTASSAYAFMVFNLFSAPCFGAIGAMRQELGTTKRMWKAVLFQTGLAWILAVLVFNIGRLIEVIL